jgi:hypothetical protein
MLAWNDVKSEFAWEGSWRDISIGDVSLHDWQLVLDALRAEKFPMEFTVAGSRAELPQKVSEMFPRDAHDASRMLSVDRAGVRLNCHFFDENEIEFDLDPREVGGQAQLDAVVAFMKVLACATGRFALMTPENMHEHAFIRVSASGTAEYISSDGFFAAMRDA